MSLGFGMQHLVLPFVDWQTSLSRFFATFLAAPVFALIYHKAEAATPINHCSLGHQFCRTGTPAVAVEIVITLRNTPLLGGRWR